MSKIKIISGCYGHREGILNIPKSEKDPPFEVSDAEAERLVSLGVAMYVDGTPEFHKKSNAVPDNEDIENSASTPENASKITYSPDMSVGDLIKAAKELGVTIPFGRSKEVMTNLLNEANEIPTLDVESPVL